MDLSIERRREQDVNVPCATDAPQAGSVDLR